MSNDLRILTIHAHPDDESSKGAGTIAKYAEEGICGTLVCCTGGEEGDILNPAMARPEVKEMLANVRMVELGRASAIIGYDRVELLGYRDSGMADTPSNEHEGCFAKAPLDEAVERLVRVIRRDRPHVIVTYGEDQKWYGHPDHLKVWEISEPAFDRAGDPNWYPDAGEPWQPSKMYNTVWAMKRLRKLDAALTEAGIESPFDDRFKARWDEADNDDQITARVDISDYMDVSQKALRAHATQVDPDEKFWFGIPPEMMRTIEPYDAYVLVRSTIPVDAQETDLFAGLRPN